MKEIIGLRLCGSHTQESAVLCSEVMRSCFKQLIEKHPIAYSQFLFPYVDTLSLSDIKGTEGTHIFGTHSIFCDISQEAIIESLAEAIRLAAIKIESEIIVFDTLDGAVRAEDIDDFMHGECIEGAIMVGAYGDLLSGYMQPWQLREASRSIASFVEMAYRRSSKKAFALSGGSLAVQNDCESIDEVCEIYLKKIGALAKVVR